ncbi:hypothetical protein JRQ81_008771 [Phrynocephalus forsythii]|uniref:Uncharacterized protein n=1 Tax=Phrynocephalus forsythii TaxID=171643 RepID=A0A9Q0XBL7_9SAUR|nr:hypothetical protein JRQ81_008771 [Phrynocephalus forsythii]
MPETGIGNRERALRETRVFGKPAFTRYSLLQGHHTVQQVADGEGGEEKLAEATTVGTCMAGGSARTRVKLRVVGNGLCACVFAQKVCRQTSMPVRIRTKADLRRLRLQPPTGARMGCVSGKTPTILTMERRQTFTPGSP